MKIAVGSQNPAKVEAVRELLNEYGLFQPLELVSFSVSSGVRGQSVTLDEVAKGAKRRAEIAYGELARDGPTTEAGRACFQLMDYGVQGGLHFSSEGGILLLDACAIYDGRSCRVAFAPARAIVDAVPASQIDRLPREQQAILRAVADRGESRNRDITEVLIEEGYLDEGVPPEHGLVSYFTDGRHTRKDCIKQGFSYALGRIYLPKR